MIDTAHAVGWGIGGAIAVALGLVAGRAAGSSLSPSFDVGSPPPPPPKGWTDQDFVDLAAMTARLKMNPADLLLVMASESNLNPHAAYVDKDTNEKIAVGLNQQLVSSLSGSALDTMENGTVDEQIPYVEAFFRKLPWTHDGKPYPHAGAVYANNFAPSIAESKGVDPSVVLYAEATSPIAYEMNKGFDTEGKGTITVEDLINHLRTVAKGATYRGALAELRKATSNPSLSPGLPS